MVIAVPVTAAQFASVPKKTDFNAPPHIAAEMRPERTGYRLKLLREALGYKPSEIADLLGVERTYWSRFEGGKRAISDGFAVLLVDRFGVTLDFLILGRWDKLPLDLAVRMREVESQMQSDAEPK